MLLHECHQFIKSFLVALMLTPNLPNTKFPSGSCVRHKRLSASSPCLPTSPKWDSKWLVNQHELTDLCQFFRNGLVVVTPSHCPMTKTVVMGCHLSRRLPLVFVALDAALASIATSAANKGIGPFFLHAEDRKKCPLFHSQELLIVEREQQK